MAALAASTTREELVHALVALSETPSPRGAERPAAERVAALLAERWPGSAVTVDPFGARGANLVARSGAAAEAPELVLYSHLDTSLDGSGPLDEAVTGDSGQAPGLTVDGDVLRGAGLAVARGPAAAALCAWGATAARLRAAAVPHRITLLLAGGGTHRARWDGTPIVSGVEHHLATHPRPAAALVAKCGPVGILHEEPGAAYLRVRVRTRHGAALARDRADPPGGLAAHAGPVIAAVEGWRRWFVARPGVGQIRREAAIGALRAGSPEKADLLPGLLELHLYVMTLPGDTDLADGLAEHVRRELAGGPLGRARVEVDGTTAAAAGRTPPSARIVRATTDAWTAEHGTPPPELRDWTGSTDGVVFRAAGVDTARTGPPAGSDPDSPRADRLSLAELDRFARVYARTIEEWVRPA